jgi:enamine deaminase RidA (YjgF/YER057c/UK114 family)
VRPFLSSGLNRAVYRGLAPGAERRSVDMAVHPVNRFSRCDASSDANQSSGLDGSDETIQRGDTSHCRGRSRARDCAQIAKPTTVWSESSMTHRRIRPFNTRDTYPEQDLDNDLCQAVVAGNTVYLRGQIGEDIDTNESVGIGDVEAQAERAMANIDMLLREAGSELSHIVKVVVYIVDPRYRETVYRVMGRWLKGVHPVSTGLVVSALARPEWLVEIDATAVIPQDA